MDEDAYDREHKQSTYLRRSLEPSIHSVIAAAEALSELSAAEVLPRLRLQLGLLHNVGDAESLARQAIAKAVARLEARETLPRPAESASSSIETLPRAVEASERATDTLPRITSSEANNP